MSDPIFLTTEEVLARYRSQISRGTLRNWRSMRLGPSFVKLGKTILSPLAELETWDRQSLVVCRSAKGPLAHAVVQGHTSNGQAPLNGGGAMLQSQVHQNPCSNGTARDDSSTSVVEKEQSRVRTLDIPLAQTPLSFERRVSI